MLSFALSAAAAAAQTPTLSLDAASGRHPISPEVYGIASGVDANFAREIRLPNVRWGGDAATRYNWEVDSSNAGFDWYFMGGSGQANPVPSAGPDAFVQGFQSAGTQALLTVPIIPYVNKTAAWNCSFPVSVYGAQQSTNPYVHPNGDNCGNSLTAAGGQLTDNNIYANHVDNSVQLQQGWLQHLIARFGTGANGGVAYYQLDNEPFGWGNTHRDVEPGGASYATITALGEQYAAMIKQQDPSALVLGPSDFTLGGWIGNPQSQNGLYAGQYYLQQMAAYQAAHGTRILDAFDEHYYPSFSDAASQLAATRTLWDPTYNGGTWVEQYFFNGPMQLIPRFKQWIAQYYPGTKLALSEYSIDSGQKQVTDALAEADVLGILGREGVDFANMWYPPAPTDPIAYSFRLFRNYDGAGAAFGETGIAAASTDGGQLAVYGAPRAADGALTAVVINKTAGALQTTLSLANFNASSAKAWSYGGANLRAITALGGVSINNGQISYNFPAYSATVFAIAGTLPAAAPVASGTYTLTNHASNLQLAAPASGTQPVQTSAGQKWVLSYANGYYTVANAASGLLLTDPNGAKTSGTPLALAGPQASPDTQLWSLSKGSTGWVLHNKATGLVIDDPGASKRAGTGIILWPQNGGGNQSWAIQ